MTCTLQSNTVAGVYDPNITPQRQWLNTTLRTILKSSGPEKRDEIAADLRLAISRQLDIPSNSFARAEEIAAAVARGGVDLGGHTASHPNLALCQPDELATELLRGKDRLATISGQSPRWFAYPFGGKGAFNPAAADAVRDAAFDGACTLLTGTVRVDTGRYAVPRIAVSPAMTMETFRARVKGAPLYTGMEKIHSAMSKKRRYG
ncbi:polysaccharide deacetylase family protein [Thiohalophilus sp.]|uniref:polysaccharide deacetylase family protein n=1 Tax=Thiohalophilus sp. TaxID=3028392 RepID=UPI002ACE5E0B|nr:polysaccharide deacetylase family protein [Thiohalophilus sp.]MDZ7804407.1 polysaccharide deacetylase family protein [Thiohalophilus sp.]